MGVLALALFSTSSVPDFLETLVLFVYTTSPASFLMLTQMTSGVFFASLTSFSPFSSSSSTLFSTTESDDSGTADVTSYSILYFDPRPRLEFVSFNHARLALTASFMSSISSIFSRPRSDRPVLISAIKSELSARPSSDLFIYVSIAFTHSSLTSFSFRLPTQL